MEAQVGLVPDRDEGQHTNTLGTEKMGPKKGAIYALSFSFPVTLSVSVTLS